MDGPARASAPVRETVVVAEERAVRHDSILAVPMDVEPFVASAIWRQEGGEAPPVPTPRPNLMSVRKLRGGSLAGDPPST
jgi:hypothetical protein